MGGELDLKPAGSHSIEYLILPGKKRPARGRQEGQSGSHITYSLPNRSWFWNSFWTKCSWAGAAWPRFSKPPAYTNGTELTFVWPQWPKNRLWKKTRTKISLKWVHRVRAVPGWFVMGSFIHAVNMAGEQHLRQDPSSSPTDDSSQALPQTPFCQPNTGMAGVGAKEDTCFILLF